MVLNQKLRRHSGRVTPRLVKGMTIRILIEEGLEPQVYWDDWKDYRDGFRGSNDRKMLREEHMPLSKYFDLQRKFSLKIHQFANTYYSGKSDN